MMHARSWLFYVFLAIPIGYLLLFVGFPIVYNLMMSFQTVALGNIMNFFRPFIGLENYQLVLADPAFRRVFVNSLVFMSVNVVAQVGIGLLVALFFSLAFPGAQYLRGLLLAAWMLPALVVGALWKWIFATEYGVANFLLRALGLISERIHWLSDPSVSLTSVTIANIWFGMPFCMILVAAGLTTIPREHYEAAALDGAGPIARFRFITLPALRPMFRQVPIELEEAAFMDGASRFRSFRLVVLPIVRVALLVVGALTFVQAYGQFVYPLTLLSTQGLQPATVGIYGFVGAEYADWHRVMAFASLFIVPVLILFLALQNRIVSGLTAGALK